jgi:hypothetical protein
MSIEEMRKAGITLPPYKDEIIETDHGPVQVTKQEPETDEGLFDPKTGQVKHFHREESENPTVH